MGRGIGGLIEMTHALLREREDAVACGEQERRRAGVLLRVLFPERPFSRSRLGKLLCGCFVFQSQIRSPELGRQGRACQGVRRERSDLEEKKSERLSSQGGGGIYITAVPLKDLPEHPHQLLALADASSVGDLHGRVALPDKCGIEYGLERIKGNGVGRVK